MSRGKILFQISGSIACYKACQLLSRLVQSGFEVEVVASKSALAFVGEATLEGLTGKPVHTDTFARGQTMNHIHLIRWADLVLLCPASANTINKFASGVADDLLSTLFLAHDFRKPYLVAPAMNAQMLRHPATQASIEKLTEWGIEFLGTGSGALACGEVGEGRLLEPDVLYSLVEKRFAPVPGKKLELLITAGGTREPIDGVRSIANSSTGRTGAALADYFSSQGHRVTFLHARDSSPPNVVPSRDIPFSSFADLEKALKKELGQNRYDAVIHAAAVADFTVDSVNTDGRAVKPEADGKIDSQGEISIKLKRTPKLVDHLRDQSLNPKLRVVAFKLTMGADSASRERAVETLAERARPDFIVHNDLSEITSYAHGATIYSGNKKIATTGSKAELARRLENYLLETEAQR